VCSDLRQNRLTEFPAAVLALPNLRTLLLGVNKITAIPSAFAQSPLTATLQELDLGTNQLKQLWPNIQAFKALSTLNIENNNLERWVCGCCLHDPTSPF
jgi:Leucine-rich repeat (LRR) protein